MTIPSPKQKLQGNSSGETPPETWGFTQAHRIGIAMLVGIMAIVLTVQWIRHPARLDDPVVIIDGAPLALDPRIDPNTADAISLARLPKVSDDMAAAIVAYREDRAKATGDKVVFRSLADLSRVKVGTHVIPKATLEGIQPYLKLMEDTPATRKGGKLNLLTPPKVLGPDTQPVEPDPD